MNINSVKTTVSKPVIIGLVTLVLGIVIGVAAEKYVKRSSVPTQAAQAADAAKPSTGGITPPLLPDPFDSWDPFREMRSLQAEMDEMFRRSIARFRQSPRMNIFADDAGYSLSLDVRESKDRYEVRAFLPDAKASDTKVNLAGNRLEVEVTHKQTEQQQNTNNLASTTKWGRYTQTVELAGKLKGDQMKVERKEHELLITIPKS